MRVISLIIAMLLSVASMAQQKHFLYIQGENQQPFYLRMDGVIYSSSASGHIIIPRLDNGPVDMIVGFPRSQWPEQRFTVEIKSADKGLVLKNNAGKSWLLQDLQTQSSIEGQALVSAKQTGKEIEKKKTDDPFATSLADAINDPGIRDVDLVKNENKAPVVKKTTPPVVSNPPVSKPVDTAVVAKPVVKEIKPVQEEAKPVVAEAKPAPVVVPTEPFVNEVKKLFENKTGELLNLLYLDRNGRSIDTVYVSFDVQPEVDSISLHAENLIKQQDSIAATKTITEKVKEVESIQKAAVAETPVQSTTEVPLIEKPVVSESEKTKAQALPSRKDCKQVATEKDMVSARKKAYTMGTDADVIAFYTKEVKSKCYSVALLQALSFAFVNDAARYQFFQDAYPWVYDPSNYEQLERLFVSKEYISKFRKLINAE